MKQATKKITTAIAAIFFSIAAFAAKHDQLPLHSSFTVYPAMPLSVDLQWVAATETLVLLADNPAGRKIFVTLRDESGSVLLRSVIPRDQKKIEKNYSFAEAEEGKYSIDIFDGSKTVTKIFNLQRVQRTETIVSIL